MLKPGMDFRLPEHRREVFLRFYDFHIRYQSHPGCVYYLMPWLSKKLCWSQEQKLWFAFINGNTQNPVTSLVIMQEFPDLLSLHIQNLKSWFDEHWTGLQFDTDRRYQKKLFPEAVRLYQSQVYDASDSQEEYWREIDFKKAWKLVRGASFLGFGRLSAFSYLEYLRIMGIPIVCDDLFLQDIKGSRSHRNGLAILLGRDDLDWKDNIFIGYQKEHLAWFKQEAERLLEESKEFSANNPHAEDIGYFTLESALCTYKSWHRPNRRYPNVYNDMLYRRIKDNPLATAEQKALFWQARKECLPQWLRLEDCPGDPGLTPVKQNHYLKTGEVIMMEREWPEFSNHWNKQL